MEALVLSSDFTRENVSVPKEKARQDQERIR